MYPPSEAGFCDVSGNVWEWGEDHFNGFDGSSKLRPSGPFSWLLIGREQINDVMTRNRKSRVFKRGKPLTSGKIGSWAHTTGSHVF